MVEQAHVGAVGTVVRVVRGGPLPGEIRVVDAGEVVLLMAYASDRLDTGRRVRVVRNRGSRQVDVEPWP